MKDNIIRPYKGLHKDNSKQDQPKDTFLFALNAINETELGDFNFISNEESNKIITSLPVDYIPIGKIYIGDNEVVIFSVSKDNTISEIGILTNNSKYITHVNDATSINEDKLNFKITHQISGIYRLRRGCEKTIYFTDNNQRPRYFNFNSPKKFQNRNDNTWNANYFNLQKQYSKIPNFQSVKVNDIGGSLEPGAYNIAIQYIDDNLNPTEWITSSPIIKIYNDFLNKSFDEINGSINSDSDYIDFPITSKAIEINLSNLDSDFLYYRLAFIESISGSGEITNVKYTNIISTTKTSFIYTGTNSLTKGTQEEIALFSDIIHKAQSIEQIENKLILGNTEGKQVNYCKLQKYASKIKADVIIKEVNLSDINDPSNPKNPVHEFYGKGYMPGEIYSFGIVYIFEDGSTSPVYHIPGKSPVITNDTIFSETNNENNICPMSNIDNSGSSNYIDTYDCDNEDYWGRDSEGLPLKGAKIRHHKFPLRNEINIPLVTDNYNIVDNNFLKPLYYVQLIIQGSLLIPKACPENRPNCGDDIRPSFFIRASYSVNDQNYSIILNIEPVQYTNNKDTVVLVDLFQNGEYHNTNEITDIVLEISDENNEYQLISTFDNSIYWDTQASFVYGTTIKSSDSLLQGRIFKTNILGIKFSNIDVPQLNNITEKIIGYYIVRNERTEFDKTILDTGVTIPTVTNNNYISHGLLAPELNLNSSIYVHGLIHPEHKFKGKEYVTYDELIVQGTFEVENKDRLYGLLTYDDVYDGTTYDKDKHASDSDDALPADGESNSKGLDGWSFNILSRNNIVKYKSINNSSSYILNNDNIIDRFYLDALDSKNINDNKNDVYNISSDNKIGIIQFKSEGLPLFVNKLCSVVMKRKNLNPYSNFRTLPYYKDTVNPFYFDKDNNDILQDNNTATVFGGDSYVSSMKYVNTMFWRNRVAKRSSQSNFLQIILGAALAVLGTAAFFITGGLSSLASTLVIGAGVSLLGGSVLLINSGIKQENLNKAYNEEYDKGLRETVSDNFIDSFYNYKNDAHRNPGNGTFGFVGNGSYGPSGPTDDTIQWIGDCLSDLWFDTTININLRHKIIDDNTPAFLNSPSKVESSNTGEIHTIALGETGFLGTIGNTRNHFTNSNSIRHAISSLEKHLVSKLLVFDPKRDDNKYYIGLALGEYYHVNPDYERTNKQKTYTHLALEYDCCSDCREDFPHRWHWSEESFQEELSDNFRIFLPNNYKDISGNNGEITNIFKIGHNLFIHTSEAIWQIPRNHQERITDQIVSFIGTGSYGAIPARKILDDDTGSSAGLQHKWSAIKTLNSYFFVSENQKKIYQFDGRQLKPISSTGLSNWFKENIELLVDKNYYNLKEEKYPYRDNPSNVFGSGFISTYDSKKERLLFTKKDFGYNINIMNNNDFKICNQNEQIIIFNNFNQTINDRITQGWKYIGIEDCKMKFEKIRTETIKEIRTKLVERPLPNNTDIFIQLDMTDSFDHPDENAFEFAPRNRIRTAVRDWINNFTENSRKDQADWTNLNYSNPDWKGRLYLMEIDQHATRITDSERYLKILDFIKNVNNSSYNPRIFIYPTDNIEPQIITPTDVNKNVIVLSFINESLVNYHDVSSTTPVINATPNPKSTYYDDFNEYVNLYNEKILSGGSFKGIIYPIVFNRNNPPLIINQTISFLQHVMSALKGIPYTVNEINNLIQNSFISNEYWELLLIALQNLNPYPNYGLDNYGWSGKFDKGWDSQFDGRSNIITPEDIQADIGDYLKSSEIEYITETQEVDVIREITDIEYVEGTLVNDPINMNNSWTISYSLKSNSWISWHSYLPSFYINIPEKFYSWKHGNNNIWKHNTQGHYQTFYGKSYPHIIEYVSLSTPLITRLWNHIKLQTEAKQFNNINNEYVDKRFTTFNKAVLYNSRQCSGVIDLIIKDAEDIDYLSKQILNDSIIDRNERDWAINNFRDIRIDYNQPIWKSDINSLQSNYFIDKVINNDSLDVNKDWAQLESFRDKYLVVRLIFNKFVDNKFVDNIKLITNYLIENEEKSFR